MSSGEKIRLLWRGAAHYQLRYKGLVVLIDPLFTRLPGDKPHLEEQREDVERVDFLLLTHGHLDHSWDFPYLAARHNPVVYAPAECLGDISREETGSDLEFDRSRCHALEEAEGQPFAIGGIEVTAWRIGTEEIDFWFIREMVLRPFRHGVPASLATGFKWLTHHLYCNCFAYHFRFPDGGTMLYFGNLTDDVRRLEGIERVDVLAIPYCPANRKWIRHSQHLIERFDPDVTMVHHFDNFMNPFTLSKYMNLDHYRKAILERCPGANLYFSRFAQDVSLAEITLQ
ncbi:MAG: hypothetical protein Kow0099_26890 [Candidatus Abyssubacteria bacterium]